MSTNWSEDYLSGYLDDELSATEKTVVEERLSADPQLLALLRSLAEQRDLLRAQPRVHLQRDLSASVLDSHQVSLANAAAVTDKSRDLNMSNRPHRSRLNATPPEARTGYALSQSTGTNIQQWKIAGSALITLAACLLLVVINVSSLPDGGETRPTVNAFLSGSGLVDDQTPSTSEEQLERSAESQLQLVDGRDHGDILSGLNDDRQDASKLAETWFGNQPETELVSNSAAQQSAETQPAVTSELRSLEQWASPIVMVRMNPVDIQNQWVQQVLDELGIRIVGNKNLMGAHPLLVDTTLASFKLMLRRIGGQQSLAMLDPTHEFADLSPFVIDDHVAADDSNDSHLQDGIAIQASDDLASADQNGQAICLVSIELPPFNAQIVDEAAVNQTIEAAVGSPLMSQQQSELSNLRERDLLVEPDTTLANDDSRIVAESDSDQLKPKIHNHLFETLDVTPQDAKKPVRSLLVIVADERVPQVAPSNEDQKNRLKLELPRMFDEMNPSQQVQPKSRAKESKDQDLQ
ncbi:MAG TPA: hypothetical protein PKD64_09425 [Pirellulaceae bacterium]|nr:hypothetical protein [Pirellulaceae bacterium]HMO92407.1 hypothetical protein [Pirellulaceae bacterium]HMP69526.1 hypothetical protein [Pirellulaceae bacterium]